MKPVAAIVVQMLIFEVLVDAVDVASLTIDSFICGRVCLTTQPGAAAYCMSLL